MGNRLLKSDDFILFWRVRPRPSGAYSHGPARFVDGYSKICHGRHLRDQGDSHTLYHVLASLASCVTYVVKPISFICHRCGLDRVIIAIWVAALAAGCNGFLTKPVSLEWFNYKIREWGSIKVLQMLVDSWLDFVKSASAGQALLVQNFARRLHMPEQGPHSLVQGPDDLAHVSNP
jgi:hypothetical protein